MNRRRFLHSMAQGAGAFGLGLTWGGSGIEQEPLPPAAPATHWNGAPLGRILLNVMTAYEEPSWRAKPTGQFLYFDDVIAIQGVTGAGEGLYTTNPTWLLTEKGYIYSSWVQPVQDNPNNPIEAISPEGAWAEVAVPKTFSRSAPSATSYIRETLYYSTVNRITAMQDGFYQVEEIYGQRYWVAANHMRIIRPEEIAPLSPEVPADQKRIEVSTYESMLYAFEGETVVNSFKVSLGMLETPTPLGDYSVIIKRVGQRMTGGASADYYNLPGIPYVCYINRMWVATHGCYWHNDYLRRHSNGCVNLLPDEAKWVFRWTTPHAAYGGFSTEANAEAGQPGTRVLVRV